MKLFFLINFTLAYISILAQQNDLILPAGAQKTLTTEERILSLKKLSIGDNATVSSLTQWPQPQAARLPAARSVGAHKRLQTERPSRSTVRKDVFRGPLASEHH